MDPVSLPNLRVMAALGLPYITNRPIEVITKMVDAAYLVYTMPDARICVTLARGYGERPLMLRADLDAELFRAAYETFVNEAIGNLALVPPSPYNPLIGPVSVIAPADERALVTTYVDSETLPRMDTLRRLLRCFEGV